MLLDMVLKVRVRCLRLEHELHFIVDIFPLNKLMKAIGEGLKTLCLEGIPKHTQKNRYCGQPLLAIDNTEPSVRDSVYDHRAYKVIRWLVSNNVIPKFTNIFLVPRVRPLKARDNEVTGVEQVCNRLI